jgi:hypothetical protein
MSKKKIDHTGKHPQEIKLPGLPGNSALKRDEEFQQPQELKPLELSNNPALQKLELINSWVPRILVTALENLLSQDYGEKAELYRYNTFEVKSVISSVGEIIDKVARHQEELENIGTGGLNVNIDLEGAVSLVGKTEQTLVEIYDIYQRIIGQDKVGEGENSDQYDNFDNSAENDVEPVPPRTNLLSSSYDGLRAKAAIDFLKASLTDQPASTALDLIAGCAWLAFGIDQRPPNLKSGVLQMAPEQAALAIEDVLKLVQLHQENLFQYCADFMLINASSSGNDLDLQLLTMLAIPGSPGPFDTQQLEALRSIASTTHSIRASYTNGMIRIGYRVSADLEPFAEYLGGGLALDVTHLKSSSDEIYFPFCEKSDNGFEIGVACKIAGGDYLESSEPTKALLHVYSVDSVIDGTTDRPVHFTSLDKTISWRFDPMFFHSLDSPVADAAKLRLLERAQTLFASDGQGLPSVVAIFDLVPVTLAEQEDEKYSDSIEWDDEEEGGYNLTYGDDLDFNPSESAAPETNTLTDEQICFGDALITVEQQTADPTVSAKDSLSTLRTLHRLAEKLPWSDISALLYTPKEPSTALPALCLLEDSSHAALKRLSELVKIRELNLDCIAEFFSLDVLDPEPEILLTGLADLLEGRLESLSEFGQLSLCLTTYGISWPREDILGFYLTTDDGELCGVGQVSIKEQIEDQTLLIYPREMRTKIAYLVDAVNSSFIQAQERPGLLLSQVKQNLEDGQFVVSDQILEELKSQWLRTSSPPSRQEIARTIYHALASIRDTPLFFVDNNNSRGAYRFGILTAEEAATLQ